MTLSGRVLDEPFGWQRYPHVHVGLALEDLKVQAGNLKRIYQHVRIVEKVTEVRTVW